MADIMQPSEKRQTDTRAKAHAGYQGTALFESYGDLLPVDKVLGGMVTCTGGHKTDDDGNLFLECREVEYVKFKPSDYIIKGDGVQWLPARFLIVDLAGKPSDWVLKSQEQRQEQENLEVLFLSLLAKLRGCPVPVCMRNFPGNPSHGVVVIKSRDAVCVPTVSYDRFESANLIGNYAVSGERKHWDLGCFWQFDEAQIEARSTEIAQFAQEQVDVVDRGLAEIAALNMR